MSRILFLDSVAGVAGDMFVASFIDAGLVTAAELAALPDALGLTGVKLSIRPVLQAQIRATYLEVQGHGPNVPSDAHDPPGAHPHLHLNDGPGDAHRHAHYVDIDRCLARSQLPTATRELARRILRTLAEAEAHVHGMDLADVSFHEIGTIDSIMDVVMAAYCIDRAAAERIYATPLKPGRGTVTMDHGTHPIPPPASARLLLGLPLASTPAAIQRADVELSTPTGIAILRTLNPTFVAESPAGRLCAVGCGSGSFDFGNYPNVFRTFLLDDAPSPGALPYETDRVVEISCNLDDDTAERIAWLAAQLLQEGALDVWQTPIVGKKGRLATCITALASLEKWEHAADWLLRNSSTFGLRHRIWDRIKLARRFERRHTDRGDINYKVGLTTTGEPIKEKAEFEDTRKIWEQPSPADT